MHHVRVSRCPANVDNSFLALLLPNAPLVGGHWAVNQNSVVITADLACLCLGRCGQSFGLDFF
jgi:hypothetical protein